MKRKCIVCCKEIFSSVFGGKTINNYSLNRCTNCGMVLALPESKAGSFNYSNYGEYLILNKNDIQRRVKSTKKRKNNILKLIKQNFKTPKILDFGCGAGYFCKAAEENGFEVFGIEPSDKLRAFSKDKLGFQNILKSIGNINQKFDAICMFDVIEHLPLEESRNIMAQLVNHLNPNGMLIGNTPNFKSANILLCKDKDPVIWPPSHICYFTKQTLHKYLTSLELNKIKLYSRGFSSNSFFRKTKFEKSFLEKSVREQNIILMPISIVLRAIFQILGYLQQPLDLGYEIYFTYQKVN